MPVKVEIGYGELFDKLTILVNKIYNCPKEKDVSNSILELMRLLECVPITTSSTIRQTVRHHIKRTETLKEDLHLHLKKLRNINRELWELEEQVRIEGDSVTRSMLSDKIRDLNRRRAETKREIDILFLEDLKEVKDYDTKSK